jgi:hypothetical protein
MAIPHDPSNRGIDFVGERIGYILGATPQTGSIEFFNRRMQFPQVGHVLAFRTLIDGGVQLHVDEVVSVGNEDSQSPEAFDSAPGQEPVGQPGIEHAHRTEIQPIRIEPKLEPGRRHLPDQDIGVRGSIRKDSIVDEGNDIDIARDTNPLAIEEEDDPPTTAITTSIPWASNSDPSRPSASRN